MEIQHERGYVIMAVGDTYERCADRLVNSLLDQHPDAKITIITKNNLPFGDLGGYANDWQVWHASPYRQTIKLEADMIAAGPIDHWWTLFENKDVVISQGCRDYYGQISNSRHYRKLFDQNDLPDVYNAITYWRLSNTAKEFFNLIKTIFEQWESYKKLLKFPEETPSTDVVYAMAAKIMGVDRVTLPPSLGPKIVHMKAFVNPIQGTDWTKELVWETDPLRINTVAQWGLVHYHIKEWNCEQ